MPPRRPESAATADAARLTVLAASDENAFVALAADLLASRSRDAREAALHALSEHPTPRAVNALRRLYLDLDADGAKLDQGATMRMQVVRILTEVGTVHDTDIALRACDTREKIFGQDTTANLRALGLRMLASLNPDLFPYIAAEHVADRTDFDTQPAETAFQLLAGTGHLSAIYQWLVSEFVDPDQPPPPPSSMAPALLPMLADAPREVLQRYVRQSLDRAIRSANDDLVIALADTIVQREMDNSYPALATLMRAKISDELYNYLAVLLAGTGRPPLLAILERELHRGRRPKVVAEALAIRPTPDSRSILKRWQDGEPYDDDGGAD